MIAINTPLGFRWVGKFFHTTTMTTFTVSSRVLTNGLKDRLDIPAWYSQWHCSLCQVALEAQLECLTDCSDNILRKTASTFNDVARSTVDVVFRHICHKVHRVLKEHQHHHHFWLASAVVCSIVHTQQLPEWLIHSQQLPEWPIHSRQLPEWPIHSRQLPEWPIQSHVDCFNQSEFIYNCVHPCNPRTLRWSNLPAGMSLRTQALSATCVMCPNKERRRGWIVEVSMGCSDIGNTPTLVSV